MGRQIRFYMGPRDEETFVAHLRESGNIVIIPEISKERMREQFVSLAEAEGRKFGDGCCLWHKAISPEPHIEYIEQQNVFCIDKLQSEVVEVTRSKRTREGELSMGRLWMETTSLTPDGELTRKSDQFVVWYSSLCRWIKRASVRVFDGAYVLPEADALIKSGIEPIGHVF